MKQKNGINKFGMMIYLSSILLLGSCNSITNHQYFQNITKQIQGTSSSGKVVLFETIDPLDHSPTLSNELINLNNANAFFDFENGVITNSNDADIYLLSSCGSECVNSLIEINGAKVAGIGESEPGIKGCKVELENKNRHAFIFDKPNSFSCLRTNKGNIVQIKTISKKIYRDYSGYTFEFILWLEKSG